MPKRGGVTGQGGSPGKRQRQVGDTGLLTPGTVLILLLYGAPEIQPSTPHLPTGHPLLCGGICLPSERCGRASAPLLESCVTLVNSTILAKSLPVSGLCLLRQENEGVRPNISTMAWKLSLSRFRVWAMSSLQVSCWN